MLGRRGVKSDSIPQGDEGGENMARDRQLIWDKILKSNQAVVIKI